MNYDGTFSKAETLLLCVCCLILGFTSMLLIKPQSVSNKITPQDWIKEEQVSFYEEKVCFEVPKGYGFAKYKGTNSMLPTFGKNANGIETKPDSPEAIKVGDVISFYDKETIVVHRVTEIGYDKNGWYCLTKGDNNAISDGIQVRFEQLNGVLIALIY